MKRRKRGKEKEEENIHENLTHIFLGLSRRLSCAVALAPSSSLLVPPVVQLPSSWSWMSIISEEVFARVREGGGREGRRATREERGEEGGGRERVLTTILQEAIRLDTDWRTMDHTWKKREKERRDKLVIRMSHTLSLLPSLSLPPFPSLSPFSSLSLSLPSLFSLPSLLFSPLLNSPFTSIGKTKTTQATIAFIVCIWRRADDCRVLVWWMARREEKRRGEERRGEERREEVEKRGEEKRAGKRGGEEVYLHFLFLGFSWAFRFPKPVCLKHRDGPYLKRGKHKERGEGGKMKRIKRREEEKKERE